MKYLFLNHKMNFNKDEACSYFESLNKIDFQDINVCVFPSYTNIFLANSNKYSVGSQNVSCYSNGSYTGDISSSQIASMGCKYCLIGHSERRKIFRESNEDIRLKLNNLKNDNVIPVLCVGEVRKEERYSTLIEQLDVIANLDIDNLVIAYEPVYSIGTGVVLKNKELEEVILWIREYVESIYDKDCLILYGGSVNDENIKSISSISSLDGFLIGKASLDIEKVKNMIGVISNG